MKGWIVLLMGVALSAQAEVYKCVGADGKINFTDKPCPEAARAEKVELPPLPESPLDKWRRESDERRAENEKRLAEIQARQREESSRRWHRYWARKDGQGLVIGMTSDQVLALPDWGAPDSVNKTTTAWGRDEQWIYRTSDESRLERVYLYFTNGRLTTIQN